MNPYFEKSKIVAGGDHAWEKLCTEEVSAALWKEYEEDLREAGIIRKFFIEWKIRREIRKRMKELVSPHNLHERS